MLYNERLSIICEDKENCGIGLLPAMWTDGLSFRDKGLPSLYACDMVNDFSNGNVPRSLEGLFIFHTCMEPGEECVSAENRTLRAKTEKSGPWKNRKRVEPRYSLQRYKYIDG